MLYNDDNWPRALTNYFGNQYANCVVTCKSSDQNNTLEVFIHTLYVFSHLKMSILRNWMILDTIFWKK